MTTWEIGLNIPTQSAQSENHPVQEMMEYPESNTSPETTSGEMVPIAFASVVL